MSNKVTLLGRLGSDIQNPTGELYTFSLATTETWKDKSGEKQEKTQWHRCKAWKATGKNLAKFTEKGNRLQVHGSIEYGSYEKDGIKIPTTDIIVHGFDFIDFKKKDEDEQY